MTRATEARQLGTASRRFRPQGDAMSVYVTLAGRSAANAYFMVGMTVDALSVSASASRQRLVTVFSCV